MDIHTARCELVDSHTGRCDLAVPHTERCDLVGSHTEAGVWCDLVDHIANGCVEFVAERVELVNFKAVEAEGQCLEEHSAACMELVNKAVEAESKHSFYNQIEFTNNCLR